MSSRFNRSTEPDFHSSNYPQSNQDDSQLNDILYPDSPDRLVMSKSANNLVSRRNERSETSNANQMSHKFTFTRALQEKEIAKLVSKLPYKIREGVNSVVNMTLSQTENIYKDLEVSKMEASSLRSELTKKIDEIHTLRKTCDLYQEKSRYLEENVATLKDNIDSKQKFTLKNRSAISKLATTNRLLIDSLDALQAKSTLAVKQPNHRNFNSSFDFAVNTNEISGPNTQANTAHNSIIPHNNFNMHTGGPKQRSGLLLPISNPNLTLPSNLPILTNIKDTKNQFVNNLAQNEYEKTEKQFSMFQNDKLRESLLRVSREHYKAIKNGEILEAKVSELRTSLRNQEQLNRKLKGEIAELKIVHHTELSSVDDAANKTTATQDNTSFNANKIVHKFNAIDQKFKALVERNGFDPLDGIQQLRRIMAHMAQSPQNFNLQDSVRHIVSKETIKIFDSHMISLFLLEHPNTFLGGRSGSSAAVLQQVDKHAEKAQLYTNNKILKYNVRSNKPECIELNSDIKSLVLEVMYSGKLLRLNTLHHNNNYYHLTLDACHGIVTKRMLYLPLYNKNNDSIIGCLQLVNKGQNNEAFSDLDEIFGLVFADAVSLLLTNCFLHDKICKRSLLFQSILECNSTLYSIIPDKYINKTLTIGDIIAQIESVVKDLLKCNKTRVFLCADAVGNSSNNNSNSGNANNGASNGNIRSSIISIRGSTGDNSNAIAAATTSDNSNNNNNNNNNSNSIGFMIQLEHDQMASMSASSNNISGSSGNKNNATVMVPSTSGIAGHVIQTKSIYTLVESAGFDPYMNPTIDLDNTADFAMVTVPIISNNNVVLGCIECQLGQLSPSLTNTNESNEDANKSGKYDFIQAAVSGVSQLLHSIEYLLANVNKSDIIVPQYTPKLLIKHSNLLNSSNNSNNISHTGSQNVTPRDTIPSGSGTGTGTHSGMKKNPRTNTNRNVLFITETYESQENGHEQEIYEYKQTIHDLEHTNNTQISTIKELKLQLEIKESQTEQSKLKITDLENHISTLNKQSNSRGATPKDASNSSKNNTNNAQNKEDKQKISILEHQLATLQSEIALIRHNKNVEQNNKNTAHVTQINTLTTENNNLANENKQLQTELQSTKIALTNSTDNTKNVTDRLNNTISLLNKELLNKIEHFAVEKNKIQSESEQWRSELNDCNSLLIIQKKHIAELEAKITAINNNSDINDNTNNNSNNNSSNRINNNSANINNNNNTRNNNNNSSNKSHNSSSKSLLQNTLKKQNTSDTSDYSSSSLFYSVSAKDTSIMDGYNELDNSLVNVDSNNNSWRADDRRSSVDSVLFPALVADEVQTTDDLSKQNTSNNNNNSNSANQQSEKLNETVTTTPAASTKTPSQFINALKNKANVSNTSNSNIGNNSANNSIKNNLQHNISNSSNNTSVKQPPSTTVSKRDILPIPDPVESVVESVGKLSVSQSASRNASQKSIQIEKNNNSSNNTSSNDLNTTAAVQHTAYDNSGAITVTDADVVNVSIDPETHTTNTEIDTNNTNTALNTNTETDTAYNNTTAAVDSDHLQQETDTLPAAGENNWQELQDSEGNTYYYNSATGECSWVKPDENGYIAPSDIIGAELPAVDDTQGLLQGTDLESSQVVDDCPNEINDWIRNFDEHGTEYWVHQISGESQWERPSLDDEPGGGSGLGAMYDTNMSHYSATAGDYTIEL